LDSLYACPPSAAKRWIVENGQAALRPSWKIVAKTPFDGHTRTGLTKFFIKAQPEGMRLRCPVLSRLFALGKMIVAYAGKMMKS